MNIRRPADYSILFSKLDKLMAEQLPQMELYCEIGRLVRGRAERGEYPDVTGFSPRNVRRMRDFSRMYSNAPDLLTEAFRLNWTQNVVIVEAELTMEERRWYIRKAAGCGLSKAELLRMGRVSDCF